MMDTLQEEWKNNGLTKENPRFTDFCIICEPGVFNIVHAICYDKLFYRCKFAFSHPFMILNLFFSICGHEIHHIDSCFF